MLPAAATALIAVLARGRVEALPIVIAVAGLGSLVCGFWCGFGLATRLVKEPARRTGAGFLLGILCCIASVAASFAGCVGGALMGGA